MMCKSGKHINIVDLNRHFFGVADPDFPDIRPETLAKMWEAVMPKLKLPVGKIIITSAPTGDNYFYNLYKKQMSETKILGAIHVVTDTENSYDKIGDIQGGFNDMELRDHIVKHGINGLLETLAYMTTKVVQTKMDIDHKLTNYADSINDNKVEKHDNEKQQNWMYGNRQNTHCLCYE